MLKLVMTLPNNSTDAVTTVQKLKMYSKRWKLQLIIVWSVILYMWNIKKLYWMFLNIKMVPLARWIIVLDKSSWKYCQIFFYTSWSSNAKNYKCFMFFDKNFISIYLILKYCFTCTYVKYNINMYYQLYCVVYNLRIYKKKKK